MAIQRHRGLAVVIGEAGYGKTTIMQALLAELQQDQRLAIGIVPDPRVCRTDVQFLRAVLGQFGVEATGRTGLDLMTEFVRFLTELPGTGRTALLVIDEGQHLTGSQLEILRTFLSVETPASAAIDVVIFAAADLEEKIGRKRNLARRVGMVHRLNPFNRRDTAGLIAHRLAVGGHPRANGRPLFTEDAVDVIAERSGGIPRAIAGLCDASLREADRRRRDQIDGALAAAVADRGAQTARGNGEPVTQIRLELPFGAHGEARP